MNVVFQEWVEEKTKYIRWSLSLNTETLAQTIAEIGTDGHSPLGEPLILTIPDEWKRAQELREQGTVFLKDRYELMRVFAHFFQTR